MDENNVIDDVFETLADNGATVIEMAPTEGGHGWIKPAITFAAGVVTTVGGFFAAKFIQKKTKEKKAANPEKQVVDPDAGVIEKAEEKKDKK